VTADVAEGNVLLLRGYESACVGVWVKEDCQGELLPVAVYDIDKLIEILMQRDGMTREDANEYIDFNIAAAYVGERTPIFIEPIELLPQGGLQ
jgi:hypothetical protein